MPEGLVDGSGLGNIFLGDVHAGTHGGSDGSLPLPDRVSLAQALWESIEAGLADIDEDAALRDSIRRDEELSSVLRSESERIRARTDIVTIQVSP